MDLDSEASAFSLGEESDDYAPEPVSTIPALLHRNTWIPQLQFSNSSAAEDMVRGFVCADGRLTSS